jgi:hypothetical protein
MKLTPVIFNATRPKMNRRKTKYTKYFLDLCDKFFTAQQPLMGQGLLIVDASRSRSDTPHSVELLWTSDQPGAETWHTQSSQEADIDAAIPQS